MRLILGIIFILIINSCAYAASTNLIIGSVPYVNATNCGPTYNSPCTANSNISNKGNNVGVGSVNPGQTLDVQGTVRAIYYLGNGSGLSGIGSATQTPWVQTINGGGYSLINSGNIGVGSSAPGQALDVQGTVRALYFVGNGSGLTNINASQWTTVTPGINYSGGNVGVGSANPGQELDVQGTIRTTGFNLSKSPTSGYILTSDANGNGSWVANTGTSQWSGVTGNPIYYNYSGGNVGIGTTIPTADFQVYGSNSAPIANFSNSASTLQVDQYTNLHFNGDSQLGLYFDVDVDQYALSTQGSFPLYITTGEGNNQSGNIIIQPGGTGSIGIGTATPQYFIDAAANTMQMGDTHYANPVLSFIAQSGITLDPTGAGSLMYLTSPNRYVGINTIPAYQLDVNGTINMTAFHMATGASNTYVLTSDANGNGTWQAGGGGGGAGNVGIGTINYMPEYIGVGTLGVSNIVDIAGNVGVGSTAPGVRLDVNGTLRAIAVIANGTGASYTSGNLGIGTTVPNNSLIVQTGNVGIGSAFPGQSLDVQGSVRAIGFIGNGSLLTNIPNSVSNSDGTITISPTTGTVVASLAVSHANTWTGQQIFNSANVGIGSSYPGQVLDVQGTVRAIGFNMSTSPTSGYVLTSDSKGNGSWQAAAGGGTNYWNYSASGNIGVSTTAAVGIGTTFVGGTGEGALSVMNGNVGIGTWTPNGTLDIEGGNVNIGTSNTNSELSVCYGSGKCLHFYGTASNGSFFTSDAVFTINSGYFAQLEIAGDQNKFMGLQASGGAIKMFDTIGSGNYTYGQNVTQYGYSSLASATTSITYGVQPTTGYFQFNQGDSHLTAMQINMPTYFSSGNVGIGSTAPGQALDVNGTVRALTGGSCSYVYKCVGGVDAGVLQTSACNLCPSGSCTQMNLCG